MGMPFTFMVFSAGAVVGSMITGVVIMWRFDAIYQAAQIRHGESRSKPEAKP